MTPTPTAARPPRRGARPSRPSMLLLAGLILLAAFAWATPASAAAATGGAAVAVPTSAPSATEGTEARAEPVVRLTRGQIARLQRRLRVKPVDGVLGRRTRAALRRFEGAHGLTADGRPHPDVLTLLRIAPTSGTAGPASPTIRPAIEAAEAAIGKPYAWGGDGPRAFDCSGLMVWAFARAGIRLPRTSFAMYRLGERIGLDEIAAGDLVFFDTDGPGASHVGIALGPETAISATTHGVMEHDLTRGYWAKYLIGARRLDQE